MSLTYFEGDERPDWQATVTVNGATDDMSTGYTFSVRVATDLSASAALTKTTNITGAASGVVTVAWAAGELALTPGQYVATLTATRTSDSRNWTISEPLTIKSLPS